MKRQTDQIIAQWLDGEIDGAPHGRPIKAYLRSLHGDKCQHCGWSVKHKLTGLVPLQLDHVNGNWQDWSPDNLQLICPNCHSLTETFGALNIGRVPLGRRAAGVM